MYLSWSKFSLLRVGLILSKTFLKVTVADNMECYSICSRKCAVECGQNFSFLRNMTIGNCDDSTVAIRTFYVVLIVILIVVISVGCITIMLVLRKLMCITYITTPNREEEGKETVKADIGPESSSHYSNFMSSSTCYSDATTQEAPNSALAPKNKDSK